MRTRRIQQVDIAEALEDLIDIGVELGIEGAERWTVGNPYGPTGLKFYETDPEHRSVSMNTKLGAYDWDGPKQAHREMRVMYRALVAARNAGVSMDATARREDRFQTTP